MANLHLNFRSDMLMRSVYPRVFLPDYNDWNDVAPTVSHAVLSARIFRRGAGDGPRLPTSLCTLRCMASPL